MEFSVDRPARPPVAYLSGVLLCCVLPVLLHCVALCCDLLSVVSSGCVALRCVAICCLLCHPVVFRLCCVALHCIVLQSAVCCVDLLCCVALCCCYALYLFCFDVVFSSLSLRCVFPVVFRFLSCLLLLVFCWSPLSCKCAAFFDQIFPWSFRSINQFDRLFHICLGFCVVPVLLRCVVLGLAVCCVVVPVVLRCDLCIVLVFSLLCCVVLLCCYKYEKVFLRVFYYISHFQQCRSPLPTPRPIPQALGFFENKLANAPQAWTNKLFKLIS